MTLHFPRFSRPPRCFVRELLFACILVVPLLAGCEREVDSQAESKEPSRKVAEIAWVSDLVRAENLILKLTPQLGELSKAVVAGQEPKIDGAVVASWKPLPGKIESFRHAKFYFVNGEFSSENPKPICFTD